MYGQTAAAAYQQQAQTATSPRELEALTLTKAANRLQNILDDWDNKVDELDEQLMYNRRIWVIFVSSVTDENSPLPIPLRNNMANLGLYIFKTTFSLFGTPDQGQVESLIRINREIALGLRT